MLDGIGYVSHAQLDLWEAGGALEEAVEGLQEAWGLSLLHGDLFNRRIKRGEHGRFGGVVGGPKKETPTMRTRGRSSTVPAPRIRAPRASVPRVSTSVPTHQDGVSSPRPIRSLKGNRGPVKGRTFKVYATPPGDPDRSSTGDIPDRETIKQFAAENASRGDTRAKTHAAGRARLSRLATEARKRANAAHKRGDFETRDRLRAEAQVLDRAQANPSELQRHGKAELYGKRADALNKRIEKAAGKASRRGTLRKGPTPAASEPRGQHSLTAAEAHFNDGGHVSQKTLLAYADEASSQPSTTEMYGNPDGTFHPSRAILHGDIVDMLLRERNPDNSLSKTNPYLKPQAKGKRRVVFLGGAYASGKSGLAKMLDAKGELPKDHMHLDPDEIKAQLPEFQQSALSDPEANLRVYKEAWAIAQHAMADAQKKGLNVVVDGITDTSAEEVKARVKSFTDAGYVKPEIHYVSIPTDVAIQRAKDRAANGKTPSDRRMIPDVIMRAVHRDVSSTIPGVMASAKEMGATVHVHDNNQPRDPITGQGRLPQLVARARPNGQVEHQDAAAFQHIINKSQETIPGVSEPRSTTTMPDEKLGARNAILPGRERKIGNAIQEAAPPEGRKLPQPMTNPDELLKVSTEQTMPAFRDLLGKIATDVSATVHDAGLGKSQADTGAAITGDMGSAHVLIAPVKGRARMLQKMAADGTPTDASGVHDTVRGTLTVPTANDVPAAIRAIVRQAEANGWKVERNKNKLADSNGSKRMSSSGYGDFTLILRAPASAGGLATELQVNTNPMWWTKEVGMGHKFYELERQIKDRATTAQRKQTSQEDALLGQISKSAKPLYDTAWGMATNGTIPSDIGKEVVGNQGPALKSSLADLTAQTAALPPNELGMA